MEMLDEVDKVYRVKSRGTQSFDSMKRGIRSNPTKWAGIAAGAGFGLGLIGRIMRHRAGHDSIPHIVIVEGD